MDFSACIRRSLRESLHYTPKAAGFVMSFFGVGALTSIAGGWIGDRFSPRVVLSGAFWVSRFWVTCSFLQSPTPLTREILTCIYGVVGSAILYVNLAGYHVKSVQGIWRAADRVCLLRVCTARPLSPAMRLARWRAEADGCLRRSFRCCFAEPDWRGPLARDEAGSDVALILERLRSAAFVVVQFCIRSLEEEGTMSSGLVIGARGFVAVASVLLMSAATARAQGHWEKAAPFPEPEEELYGVAANGKMYVMGGYGEGGKPVGMVWEYDPAVDKWTKKKHDGAAGPSRRAVRIQGQDLRVRRIHAADGGPERRLEADRQRLGIQPGTDTWKALAPMPTSAGRRSPKQEGGKIYVIGGAAMHPGSNVPAVFANGSGAFGDDTTKSMIPRRTSGKRAARCRPRATTLLRGAVNGKIYVMGGRIGSPFITVSSNIDVVEEYDPATDMWGALKTKHAYGTQRRRLGHVQQQDLRDRRRDCRLRSISARFARFEAYDPAKKPGCSARLPSPRHGVAGAVIGNKIHFVSGKITSGGYEADLKLSTPAHDVFVVDK